MLRFTVFLFAGLLLIAAAGCKQPDQVPPTGNVSPPPSASDRVGAGATQGGGGGAQGSSQMIAPEPPL